MLLQAQNVNRVPVSVFLLFTEDGLSHSIRVVAPMLLTTRTPFQCVGENKSKVKC